MPRLSQMPFVNGDPFANLGAGAQGVNNFFGNLLQQAQMRQNMKDAAQRLAIQQQLAPYTMMRSLAYAQQAPALISQANSKANELNMKLQLMQQLAGQQPTQNAPAVPQKQPIMSALSKGVIKEPNGDISPLDSIAGRMPVAGSTVQQVPASQGTSGLNAQQIQQANMLGIPVKATPEQTEQAKEQGQEKFESFKNAKEIKKNVNTAADRLTSEAENLADVLDLLKNNKDITHPGLGIPMFAKAFGTEERGKLQEKLGKIVTDETKGLTNRAGIGSLNLVANTLKPSMGNTVEQNIGMTKALIANIGQDFDNLKRAYESEDAGNGGKGSFQRDLPPRARKIYDEYLKEKEQSEQKASEPTEEEPIKLVNKKTGKIEIYQPSEARRLGLIK